MCSHQNPPYLTVVTGDKPGLFGNGRYEGFLMDLVAALENSTGARLEVDLVKDGRYGARPEQGGGPWTGEWRGQCPVVATPCTVQAWWAR